jgi:CHAT domain-containing protein
MLSALKQKRPVVHVASHFSFRPGDEHRSFLLTGDGGAFTLDEFKRHSNMFGAVDLLTLSACNTGAQQADANGREVDAFFELAQRLGANSVMATLWPVADNSTPWLMREFYSGKVNGKLTKAESLRRAQLALLKGESKIASSARRETGTIADVIVVTADGKRDTNTRADDFVVSSSQAPLYKKDPQRPFAHPFYWSPFILIGNWK